MSKTLQEITQDFQARIQELAYLMWESAGRQQGMAVQYWLEAEKQALAAMHAATSHMISELKGSTAPAEAAVTSTDESPAAATPEMSQPAPAAPPPAAEEPPAATATQAPQPVSAAAEESLPAMAVQAPPREAAAPPAKAPAARKPAARRKSKS